MAPKTAADGNAKDNSSKTFSFDDVAYLVAKLDANKIGLGMKDYQIMAKLNGTRSEHGYNHLFRTVKARGKELVPMITGGDANTSPAKSPAPKAKGKAKGEKKATKRARKARDEDSGDADDDEEPSKKVKTEGSEGEAEENAAAGDDDFN